MRIALTEKQATRFGCNVINAGQDVLMHECPAIAERLRAMGYRVTELDLSEFVRGGGAAKSLALRLSDMTVTHANRAG